MAQKTIFIAAGGTGGHLFPAVYIANALKRANPDCTIIGIGAGRPLEQKIFSHWQLPYEIIPTVGLKSRGLKGVTEFLLSFPKAIFKTIQLFCRYRPVLVIGVGGYVTAFPVIVGWLLRKPTWIHEAEMKPGMANAVLSYFATRVSTAFEACTLPKVASKVYTGHPIREGIEKAQAVVPLLQGFQPKNILVLGGSQGAQSLDDAAKSIGAFCKEHGLHVFHQCRPKNQELVTKQYEGVSDAKVSPFIENMIDAYQWADIIVSRSGAGSVSELAVINKPTIFVPFPFAQGDHQTKNAMTLVNAGKAFLEPEGEAFAARLIGALTKLVHPEEYQKIVALPVVHRSQNAADAIAKGALSLLSDAPAR